MRIAIVGSRDYPDPDHIIEYVDGLPAGTVVVSGAARGVDRIAAAAARTRGLEVVEYPADWQTYGKRAGMLRNSDIVDNADWVVAFWDGQSKGTKHTIQLAQSACKLAAIVTPDGVTVVNYQQSEESAHAAG